MVFCSYLLKLSSASVFTFFKRQYLPFASIAGLLRPNPISSLLSPFNNYNNSNFKMVATISNNELNVLNFPTTGPLKVKRLSEYAHIPTRGSEFAAGFDLYSAYDCVVPPRGKYLVGSFFCLLLDIFQYFFFYFRLKPIFLFHFHMAYMHVSRLDLV